MLLPLTAWAAAPVEDIGAAPVGAVQASNEGSTAGPVSGTPSSAARTFILLQNIQEELRQLRGIVEEQGHRISQLTQRQVDDYVDLDRRIAALLKTDMGGAISGSPAVDPPVDQTLTPPPVGASGVAPAPTERDENSYQQAYDLLKARQVGPAKQAFQAYLSDFPSGAYVANVHYWLGEIFLLENDLPQAASSFKKVREGFPAHRKAVDAGFKLAKIFHLQGDIEQAKALMVDVAAQPGSAGRLASDYLKQNF